jgi:hypothetical protein
MFWYIILCMPVFRACATKNTNCSKMLTCINETTSLCSFKQGTKPIMLDTQTEWLVLSSLCLETKPILLGTHLIIVGTNHIMMGTNPNIRGNTQLMLDLCKPHDCVYKHHNRGYNPLLAGSNPILLDTNFYFGRYMYTSHDAWQKAHYVGWQGPISRYKAVWVWFIPHNSGYDPIMGTNCIIWGRNPSNLLTTYIYSGVYMYNPYNGWYKYHNGGHNTRYAGHKATYGLYKPI